MPLPWKKVKNTRISQLVNDHLHKSQKRRGGSSLVVETGFPTSLIDLFIKNREKLKKPSKKKRQVPPVSPLGDVNDPMIRSVSPSHSPLITGSPLRGPTNSPLRLHSDGVSENLVVGSSVGFDERECGGDERECGGDERGVDVNMVLLVVLKMFVVVALALGTKRLTVGITMSAFLLCFLEYVGKHACALMKPCSVAKGVLKSTFRSVLRFLRFKEVKLDEKNGGALKNHVSRYEDHEIEVVESNRYLMNHVDEIQPEHEIIEFEASCYQQRLGYQEIESKEVVMIENDEEFTCEVAESKCKSRRSKIRSKMKKLVLKKLRSSRKEQDSRKVETVNGDNSVFFRDERVVQYEVERESDNTSELSSFSSGRYKEDDKLTEANKETGKKSEEKRDEIGDGQTWGYLLVLCAIVLAGLVAGRAFAVLLTLLWFLLLKLGENLPRYMKAPITEPSV